MSLSIGIITKPPVADILRFLPIQSLNDSAFRCFDGSDGLMAWICTTRPEFGTGAFPTGLVGQGCRDGYKGGGFHQILKGLRLKNSRPTKYVTSSHPILYDDIWCTFSPNPACSLLTLPSPAWKRENIITPHVFVRNRTYGLGGFHSKKMWQFSANLQAWKSETKHFTHNETWFRNKELYLFASSKCIGAIAKLMSSSNEGSRVYSIKLNFHNFAELNSPVLPRNRSIFPTLSQAAPPCPTSPCHQGWTTKGSFWTSLKWLLWCSTSWYHDSLQENQTAEHSWCVVIILHQRWKVGSFWTGFSHAKKIIYNIQNNFKPFFC